VRKEHATGLLFDIIESGKIKTQVLFWPALLRPILCAGVNLEK
jgi:hypothetical protein